MTNINEFILYLPFKKRVSFCREVIETLGDPLELDVSNAFLELYLSHSFAVQHKMPMT